MLLGWSSKDLAERATVGVATIQRYEVADAEINGNIHTLSAIIKCLEQAGIEFIGPENGEIGVKLVKDRSSI